MFVYFKKKSNGLFNIELVNYKNTCQKVFFNSHKQPHLQQKPTYPLFMKP